MHQLHHRMNNRRIFRLGKVGKGHYEQFVQHGDGYGAQRRFAVWPAGGNHE